VEGNKGKHKGGAEPTKKTTRGEKKKRKTLSRAGEKKKLQGEGGRDRMSNDRATNFNGKEGGGGLGKKKEGYKGSLDSQQEGIALLEGSVEQRETNELKRKIRGGSAVTEGRET